MSTATTASVELLTVKEAAAKIGVDESTIRRWIDSGRLPFIQHVEGGAIKIRADDLLASRRR